jgi:membrane-bound metal-dependent hydrolase YbcI (DUF457 family)
MQTPSHFIMTAALRYPLRRQTIPLSTGGLLIGSVLPDIPFTLLTIIYEIYYRLAGISVPTPTIMEYLHFELFFSDPIWIVGHNFFHSLVINGVLLIVGYWIYRKNGRTFLFWLAAMMLLHTVIDIFTHSSDGPLFLFPLNWTYRFASPISYWETANGAVYFAIFEYTLDALLLGFIGRKYLKQRKEKLDAT